MNILTASGVAQIILSKKELGIDKTVRSVTECVQIKSTGAKFTNTHTNSLLSMAGAIDGICDKIMTATTLGTIKNSYYDAERNSMKVIIEESAVIKDISLIFA